MVIFKLYVVLPMLVVLGVCLGVGIYVKIKHRPLIFGMMLSEVGPVVYERILDDIKMLAEVQESGRNDLERKTRRQYSRLNWLYLCQESAQTIMFLRVLRFEALRINETKSSLEYEDCETVVVQLKDEFVELRWKQVRCQLVVLLQSKLGLRVNKEMLVGLVQHYKRLEDEFVHFVGMVNEEHQAMLIERLGLRNWGLIEGQ